ncbi:MAG TPA: phospholipid carrier-dependent glycosyltransferase [Bdellovibrionota bacterium]|nr:phospholipid carrier-dependent glycosyltransferase [Bdellovibrionota bacterium]
MQLGRPVLLTCVALYVVAQILFLIQIGTPKGFSFDEFHYVPSAKQFLELKENQNWEHPPLGKMIMAVGIGIFGDNHLGWRVMSTVFGALTLVGMYLWGLALFRDRRIAFWIALLTFVNHLLYVQARIGMLDTFMFAFIAWGAAAFCAAWDTKLPIDRQRRYLAFAGWMLGLAMATKWFGVIAWASCLGLVLLVRQLQAWGVRLENAREEDWYSPTLWKSLSRRDLAKYLVLYPFLAYYAAFIPRILIEYQGPWYGAPFAFFEMQARMYDGQLRVVSTHPYMSQWWQWPLLSRPIWYAFESEKGIARGVVLLGNPLVMWGGLLALVACAVEWFKYRSRDAFLIFYFYVAFFVSWIVIPRKVSFYYYYYPAGMVLSLALGYVFFHGEKGELFKRPWARWAFFGIAAGLFVYFIPVLSGIPIDDGAFRKWMWFRSWI